MSVWQESLTGGLRLVGVSGRFDQGQSPDVEALLAKLLAEGHYRLIVDLSQVTYINSGGLRCLVTAWRQAQAAGGDVVLCSLEERIRRVFSIVGFNKVFRIFPSCEAAREALLNL